MKRILCIISSLVAGGAETFLMKVSRSLDPAEYQLDFIVSEEGGCYEQEVLGRGGRIHRIPLRTKDPKGALCGIRRIVRENEYEYVLKLGESAIAVADLIAARMGGARVLALRSCNAPTGQSLAGRCVHGLLRPLLNAVSTVKIAPSALAAEYMFGKGQKVTMLHNGVDLDVFHYDAEGRGRIRREFAVEDRLVVGHVGRFHEQKNHNYLLEIFAAIRAERPEAVLLLVGTGALEQQIRARAGELGIGDAVIFAGQRFDIPQLLSAMDVFVFPSFFEGMPNTVIEAQSTGLPCVLADTITREADLTGLLNYLSLELSARHWSDAALDAAELDRRDTRADFIETGYDIQSVAKRFVQLFGED